jgi:hypothetical protein
MIKPKQKCEDCVHYLMGSLCRAFPLGIPHEIKEGDMQHDKRHPFQLNELVFTKKES